VRTVRRWCGHAFSRPFRFQEVQLRDLALVRGSDLNQGIDIRGCVCDGALEELLVGAEAFAAFV
jgi:hypothetical protein